MPRSAKEFQQEVIAVWRCKKDGMEMCYCRNGVVRFRHGPKDAIPGDEPMSLIDAIIYAAEKGYVRVQRPF